MKVYKFGGTSVGLPDRMQRIAQLMTANDERKIIVLSALSGTTDTLVSIGDALLARKQSVAQVLIKDLRKHYDQFIQKLYTNEESKVIASTLIDKKFTEMEALATIPDFNSGNNKTLVAYGELMSTGLFHQLLQEQGHQAKLLSAFDFMRINEEGEPDLKFISSALEPLLQTNTNLFVTQGFICRNADGKTDNLKRGGSDYTASLIGAAMQVDEIQIWTDIDGMHNNDPRIVEKTFPIQRLTFDEAAELAYFGAKILHPTSILPAQQFNIRVRLKSTLNPDAPGTVISAESGSGDIKAIAAKDNITAVKIKSTRMLLAYGFLRKVFEIFEKHKTSIDMITTSEVAISLTIDNTSHLDEIVKELEHYGKVEIDQNQSIICLVGDMVATKQGVLNKIFQALSEIPIRMVSYGGSRNNISLLINSEYKKEALIKINSGLFQFPT